LVSALRRALGLGIGTVENVLDSNAIVELGHETVEVVLLRLGVSLLAGLVDGLAAVKGRSKAKSVLLERGGDGSLVPGVGGQSDTCRWQVELLCHCRLVSVRSLRGTAVLMLVGIAYV
jgi:hypothetical protein